MFPPNLFFIPKLHKFPHVPFTMTGEGFREQRIPWMLFCLPTEQNKHGVGRVSETFAEPQAIPCHLGLGIHL